MKRIPIQRFAVLILTLIGSLFAVQFVMAQNGDAALPTRTEAAPIAAFQVTAPMSGTNFYPPTLSANLNNSTTVTLNWNRPHTDTVGYAIQRTSSEYSFTQWMTITLLYSPTLSYTDTTVQPGKMYLYRLSAYSSYTASNYSNVTTVTVPPTNTTLSAPQYFSVTSPSSGTVNLLWYNANTSPVMVFIERAPYTNTNPQWSSIMTRTSPYSGWNSYTDTHLIPGNTYLYRARHFTSTSVSDYSYIVIITVTGSTTIPAPTNLTATLSTSRAVRLSWTYSPTTQIYYYLERSNSLSNTWSNLAVITGTIKVYTDTSVVSGTYSYRIRAYNVTNNLYSNYSNISNITITGLPLTAPQHLTANSYTSNTINLSWYDPNTPTALGAYVERALYGYTTTQWSRIAVLTNTSAWSWYTDTNVLPGATYGYRISLFNTYGASDYSTVATVTVAATGTHLLPPYNLTATVQNSRTVNLFWHDSNPDAIGFYVERQTHNYTPTQWSLIAVLTGTIRVYTDTNVQNGYIYNYRVRTYNHYGVSDYSNVASATITGTNLQPPYNLTATVRNSHTVNLFWNDSNTNETGFYLERALQISSTLQWNLVATLPSSRTLYTDTAVQPGATYLYRVRAYNTTGTSNYSNIAGVTLPATGTTILPPYNLYATLISTRAVMLYWANPNSPTVGFYIDRATQNYTSTQWTRLAVITNTRTVYTDTNVQPGKSYLYRVSAFTGTSISDYSNVAGITVPPTNTTLFPPSLYTTAHYSNVAELYWSNPNSNVIGFHLERATAQYSTSILGWTPIATVTENYYWYTDYNVYPGLTYFYRINAYNSSQVSDYSNVITVTIADIVTNTAQLYFEPITTTGIITPNAPISVAVKIANAHNLGAFDLNIAYDPTLLAIDGVVLGDFLGSTSRTVSMLGPIIDPISGTVSFGAFSRSEVSPTLPGPEGEGVIAYLQVRPLAVGAAGISFYNSQITDIAGNLLDVISTNSIINIGGRIGDFNNNGEVDISDIQNIANRWNAAWGSPSYELCYDINHNNEIDISDIQIVAGQWHSTLLNRAILKTIMGGPANLALSLPQVPVAPDQTFEVQVNIQNAFNLGAFESEVAYDPLALELVSVTPGAFLGSSGRTAEFLPAALDQATGHINLGAYSVSPTAAGATGNGTLVTLTFRAIKNGPTALTLNDSRITDPSGAIQSLTVQTNSELEIKTSYLLYLPIVARP